MASIKQLASGLWQAQIAKRGVRDSASRTSKVAVRNWANAREAEIEAEYLAGKSGVRSSAGVSVGDLFKLYLEMEGGNTDSAKWNTLRINKWLFSPLAALPLANVTPHRVNEWIEARRLLVSDATVNRELTLMSAAFRYGVKAKQWIEFNPCHDANHPPSGRSRKRPLMTLEEIERIRVVTGYNEMSRLNTVAARVGACFFLALETGARSGELLRAKPAHYRRSQQTLWIAAEERGGRKSARSGTLGDSAARDVPLTRRAMQLLDQLIDTTPAGQPYIVGLTDSQRDANWRKARERAMVEDLHFHDLKHEAATRLAQFLDVIALSHAIGTKDLKLLRDTYYVNDASAVAKLLPDKLTPEM